MNVEAPESLDNDSALSELRHSSVKSEDKKRHAGSEKKWYSPVKEKVHT